MSSTPAFRFRLCFFLTFLFAVMALGGLATAQSADSEPIYLEEPEDEPPAREARRKLRKEVYKDQSLRAEREVVLLSDDTELSDGKYIEYYKGGQEYVVGKYSRGMFDGEWTYYYPSGQLCKKIVYRNGKPSGQWEVLDKDGKRLSQKSYENGKRNGTWSYYYPGGEQLKIEMDYKLGKLDGQRTTYFENGQKRQEINFKAGKMDGMMTEWGEDGQKRAEAMFEDGKMNGKVIQFGKIPGVGEREVGALSKKLKKGDDELVPLNSESNTVIELEEDE